MRNLHRSTRKSEENDAEKVATRTGNAKEMKILAVPTEGATAHPNTLESADTRLIIYNNTVVAHLLQ